ncbi:helix-turn-helix domain-containing protein [Streptomyces sp. NPDC086182]|uniref:helix-turn-helix domain-containing protein n=1 Tax=Streptomyces sp. NPDC086182 TaxID=3155058 RepID=UPI003423F659
MRYAQGGGLTAERRQPRERIRFEAGGRFERGERNAVIAKDLRVSERSVERWRRVWRAGGSQPSTCLGCTNPAPSPGTLRPCPDCAVHAAPLVQAQDLKQWAEQVTTKPAPAEPLEGA